MAQTSLRATTAINSYLHLRNQLFNLFTLFLHKYNFAEQRKIKTQDTITNRKTGKHYMKPDKAYRW